MDLNKFSILHIVELIIAIVCLLLWEFVAVMLSNPLIEWGTIVGFIIIGGVLLIGHILDAAVDNRLNITFALVGGIMWIIAGGLVIYDWNDMPKMLFGSRKTNSMITGILMLINGVIYLVDAYMNWKQ